MSRIVDEHAQPFSAAVSGPPRATSAISPLPVPERAPEGLPAARAFSNGPVSPSDAALEPRRAPSTPGERSLSFAGVQRTRAAAASRPRLSAPVSLFHRLAFRINVARPGAQGKKGTARAPVVSVLAPVDAPVDRDKPERSPERPARNEGGLWTSAVSTLWNTATSTVGHVGPWLGTVGGYLSTERLVQYARTASVSDPRREDLAEGTAAKASRGPDTRVAASRDVHAPGALREVRAPAPASL